MIIRFFEIITTSQPIKTNLIRVIGTKELDPRSIYIDHKGSFYQKYNNRDNFIRCLNIQIEIIL